MASTSQIEIVERLVTVCRLVVKVLQFVDDETMVCSDHIIFQPLSIYSINNTFNDLHEIKSLLQL